MQEAGTPLSAGLRYTVLPPEAWDLSLPSSLETVSLQEKKLKAYFSCIQNEAKVVKQISKTTPC